MEGITALLNSYGKIDHGRFNGMALNVRLNCDDFQGEAGLARFRLILEVARRKAIQELQFNSISTAELLGVHREPERFAGLLVRVAGCSGHFTSLNPDLQEAIIARRPQA